jgi:Zn-dependent peptidase ImmA (M78 family)
VRPIDLDLSALSVVQVAQELRLSWHLPPGPVKDVIRTLEAAGILVVEFDFGSRRISGLSTFDVRYGMPPVIYLNRSLSGDRRRWTCAHELAHIIFHHHLDGPPPEDSEEQADLFASEFLVPASDIRGLIPKTLTLEVLADLKRHWGVSMQALVMKAAATGRMSEWSKTQWFKRFNKLGYRLDEPVEVTSEHPILVEKIVALHLNELQYSQADLCRALKVEQEDYVAQFRFADSGSLRLVPTEPHRSRLKLT